MARQSSTRKKAPARKTSGKGAGNAGASRARTVKRAAAKRTTTTRKGAGRDTKRAPARRAKRPDTRGVDWRPAFLAALGQGGNVTAAAQAAGIDRTTAYLMRNHDPEFARGWVDNMDRAADLLEAEARRRAVIGVEEPIVYKGQVTGAVRRYSDTLLIFLLKGARPEKFRDRVEIRHLTEDAIDAEIERLATELRRLGAGDEVPSE